MTEYVHEGGIEDVEEKVSGAEVSDAVEERDVEANDKPKHSGDEAIGVSEEAGGGGGDEVSGEESERRAKLYEAEEEIIRKIGVDYAKGGDPLKCFNRLMEEVWINRRMLLDLEEESRG